MTVTETLLIATDGSSSSQEAVDVGVRLARERGARITFVHSSPEIAESLFRSNPLTFGTPAEVAAADPCSGRRSPGQPKRASMPISRCSASTAPATSLRRSSVPDRASGHH